MFQQYSRKFFTMDVYCMTHADEEDLTREEEYMKKVFDDWTEAAMLHSAKMTEHDFELYYKAFRMVRNFS